MTSLWIMLSVFSLLLIVAITFPLWKQDKLNKMVAILILVLAPGASLFWYHHFGASQKLAEAQKIKQQIAQAKQEMQRYGTPKKMLARLKAHLQKKPHDDKGWYLLGKLSFDSGQYQESTNCFRKAYQLKSDDVDYKVAYAQSLFFKNNKTLSKQAKKLLTEAIVTQPENSSALNLLAVNDYLHGHYREAIARWKLLLPAYGSNSHDGEALRAMIVKAQRLAKNAM